jgi:hypothetical protein
MDDFQKDNLRRQQKMDQHEEAILDTLPRLLHRLYAKLQEQGFSEERAFILINTYMTSAMASAACSRNLDKDSDNG